MVFKKLIANLPFNPGLLDQVAFYGRRMQRDAELRRAGFIFMSLAFVVQLIAALYPAQNSLAASPNDILDGANSKTSLLHAWDTNQGNVQEVYGRFGINRDNLAAISGDQATTPIKSTDSDYWTVGHLPLSTYGISSNQWGERQVNTGSAQVYQRPLHSLDTNKSSSSYDTFHGKNSQGADFYIIKGCGNPTFHGPYVPSPPKSKITVHKTLLTGATAHPGDTVKYRLEYQNTAKDSLASNFKLTDTIDNNFEFVSLSDMASKSGNTVSITRGGSLGYSANPYVATLAVKVKSSAAQGTVICNSASVSSSDGSVQSPEKPCVTVIVNKPPPGSPPYCIATASLAAGSNKDAVVHTQAYAPGNPVTGYTYDVDANGSIDFTDKTAETPHNKTIPGLSAGTHKILVYVQLTSGPQIKCCPAEVSTREDARVIQTKSVSNITKNGGDANGTTVKPGDVLEFKLTTKNVTGTDYKNYKGQDYFGNVLQYADVTDTSQLAAQGLTLGSDKYLRWTNADLKAKASEVKTIRLKVKSPIPSTNTPSSVSPDYNCKISNDYGNQVTMNVDCPLVKQIAATTTSLPNTGPGNSVTIAAVAAIIVGYLYARSRILARELAVVRQSYIATGGV